MKFTLDAQGKTKKVTKHWQFCVGSGHAALALRQDYQEQLKQAYDELGFKRVRFHGIFNDDMNVCQRMNEYIPIPNSKRIRTDNFYQVGVVYDALLDIGIRPFVELSFMPRALASGRRTVFHYKGNITPPRNYNEWADFIKRFMNFLIDRYGKQEVLSWYYEVWNEPDLSFFWTGKQKGYMKLYDYTARAIKSVDEGFMVGGPSTSGNRWVKELKDYCTVNNVPLDFMSTHHYPGDECGHRINFKVIFDIIMRKVKGKSINNTLREILYNEEVLNQMERGILTKQAKVAKDQAGELPLFYTEWNVNSTCTAPVHDTIQSSAFLVKTVLDNQGIVDGSSYWCFSDIFEELFFFPEPFSGSFGLMNIHGIPKPSYWAFKLLNKISDERYDLSVTNEAVEIAAFRDENGLKVIIYAQQYRLDNELSYDIDLDIANIKTLSKVSSESINSTSGNPYDIWKDMGSPLNLTREAVESIKSQSQVKPLDIDCKLESDALQLKFKLMANEVKLITINY